MNHLDILREMTTHGEETHRDPNEETVAVNAIGDVMKEEFKINRGSNTSRRITNTFDETRIQEILKAVEISPDLTDGPASSTSWQATMLYR